jgi:hypothetical protein
MLRVGVIHAASRRNHTDVRIIGCVASLGPSVVACATAAFEEGLGMSLATFALLFCALIGLPTDPFDDAACLAAAGSTIVNFVSEYR